MARNKHGMIRSSDHMRNNPAMAKLDHLRVYPHADGVKLHHHAAGMEKPFAEHNFGHDEAEAFHEHMAQHTGMPSYHDGGGDVNDVDMEGVNAE